MSGGRSSCRFSTGSVVGATALSGHIAVVRPWLLRWGASEYEVGWSMPGDELVPYARMELTHAITILA